MTEDTDEPDYELLKFESGQRYNMVPDYAKAEVLVKENMTDVIQNFENFYNKINYKVKVQLTVVFLILTIEGKAVHGMDPSLGVNAGLFLLKFLASLNLNKSAKDFVEFNERYLFESHFGEKWV